MDNEQNQKIIDLLGANCSCVILKGEVERRFYGRGVQDLHRLLMESPDFLKGATVVDKVVGKAAAVLMVLGEVKIVYTPLISQLALDIFDASNVEIFYSQAVSHIVNRNRTDWCPLEKRCFGLFNLKDCKAQIDDFLKQQQIQNDHND